MMIDSLLGQQIEEYRLVSLLGKGGMARVYLGLDTRLKRYVAIKVIDTPFRGDSDYLDRFEREAQAIAQLDHPHVVRLYHYGETDELIYMAMQYIEGANLAFVMHSYRQEEDWMPPDEARRIIREIGSALDYAHQQGVVHRDVKPSNIMIDQDGRAILTDFGLALFLASGSGGETFGTPHYMAPEQAVSSAQAGPASDLYSVGVILYEMFTGRLPFDAADPVDVAVMHVDETPPSPRQVRPEISPAIESVILRALAKEPADRYPNGATLADALDNALRTVAVPLPTAPVLSIPQRVTMAFKSQALPPLPAAVAAPMAGPPAAEAGGPPGAMVQASAGRRRPWLYLGGGLLAFLLFCLLLSAAWAFMRAGSGRAAGDEPALSLTGAAATAVADSQATPTLVPALTPVDGPISVETPGPTAITTLQPTNTATPPAHYELQLAKNRDDSLFVINRSGQPFPLAALRLGDGRGHLTGDEWQIAVLEDGACVAVWKDRGRPRPPDVTCTEVGQTLTRAPRDNFWGNHFNVYYNDQEVGRCRKDSENCIINFTPDTNLTVDNDNDDDDDDDNDDDDDD